MPLDRVRAAIPPHRYLRLAALPGALTGLGAPHHVLPDGRPDPAPTRVRRQPSRRLRHDASSSSAYLSAAVQLCNGMFACSVALLLVLDSRSAWLGSLVYEQAYGHVRERHYSGRTARQVGLFDERPWQSQGLPRTGASGPAAAPEPARRRSGLSLP